MCIMIERELHVKKACTFRLPDLELLSSLIGKMSEEATNQSPQVSPVPPHHQYHTHPSSAFPCSSCTTIKSGLVLTYFLHLHLRHLLPRLFHSNAVVSKADFAALGRENDGMLKTRQIHFPSTSSVSDTHILSHVNKKIAESYRLVAVTLLTCSRHAKSTFLQTDSVNDTHILRHVDTKMPKAIALSLSHGRNAHDMQQ